MLFRSNRFLTVAAGSCIRGQRPADGQIRPSRIQGWIKDLSERFGPSTAISAFLVLQSILDLALADEAIRKNPAKSPVVQVPGHQLQGLKA